MCVIYCVKYGSPYMYCVSERDKLFAKNTWVQLRTGVL